MNYLVEKIMESDNLPAIQRRIDLLLMEIDIHVAYFRDKIIDINIINEFVDLKVELDKLPFLKQIIEERKGKLLDMIKDVL